MAPKAAGATSIKTFQDVANHWIILHNFERVGEITHDPMKKIYRWITPDGQKGVVGQLKLARMSILEANDIVIDFPVAVAKPATVTEAD